jgi:hypothetical protein
MGPVRRFFILLLAGPEILGEAARARNSSATIRMALSRIGPSTYHNIPNESFKKLNFDLVASPHTDTKF